MKDLDEIEAHGSNDEIISAASERHKRWDDALNEKIREWKKEIYL